VANIQFMHVGNLGDRPHIAIRESMPGVERHAEVGDLLAGFAERFEFGLLGGARGRAGVLACMKLDGFDAEFFCEVDLLGVGVEEQAYSDAGGFELVDGAGDGFAMANNVEAAFGRDLFAAFGHERRLIWPNVAGNRHDIFRGGEFEVQLDGYGLAEDAEVAVLDVAAVFAEVQRNSIRPAELGERGRPNRVRLVGAASLPDSGNVVDIYAEKGHESNDTRGAGDGKWAVAPRIARIGTDDALESNVQRHWQEC
jgi:hypothetical protein